MPAVQRDSGQATRMPSVPTEEEVLSEDYELGRITYKELVRRLGRLEPESFFSRLRRYLMLG